MPLVNRTHDYGFYAHAEFATTGVHKSTKANEIYALVFLAIFKGLILSLMTGQTYTFRNSI